LLKNLLVPGHPTLWSGDRWLRLKKIVQSSGSNATVCENLRVVLEYVALELENAIPRFSTKVSGEACKAVWEEVAVRPGSPGAAIKMRRIHSSLKNGLKLELSMPNWVEAAIEQIQEFGRGRLVASIATEELTKRNEKADEYGPSGACGS
jgi:hypothetical protein